MKTFAPVSWPLLVCDNINATVYRAAGWECGRRGVHLYFIIGWEDGGTIWTVLVFVVLAKNLTPDLTLSLLFVSHWCPCCKQKSHPISMVIVIFAHFDISVLTFRWLKDMGYSFKLPTLSLAAIIGVIGDFIACVRDFHFLGYYGHTCSLQYQNRLVRSPALWYLCKISWP